MHIISIFKKAAALLMVLALAAGMAACGKETEATVVRVGTSGTYSPFTYTDSNGKLTGYDIEVLRMLEGYLDDITFEFVTTGTFEGLITGLDAQHYEMVAQQIAKNAEREEKYWFPEHGYIFAETLLVVHKDDDRTELSQFEGETMGGLTNDFFRNLLDEKNDELGNIFSVNTYDDYSQLFMDISNGRVAGTLNDNIVIGYQAAHLGLDVKCVGEGLDYAYSYFLFPRTDDGKDLAKKIDDALAAAIEDGSLAALSIEWFGADYTSEGK